MIYFILYSLLLLDKKAAHPQTTQKDISNSKIKFDSCYRCGLRKERLRSCLLQRFEAVYNLSLLEEVMKHRFQNVLKRKPPRDFFAPSGAFLFKEMIP